MIKLRTVQSASVRWLILTVLLVLVLYPLHGFAFNIYDFNRNLQSTVNTAGHVVSMICTGMGVGVMLTAMFKLKRYGQARTMMSHQLSIANPIIRLIAGATLLILPTFLNTAMRSFWGPDWLANRNFDQEGIISILFPAIFSFVHLLGVIALVRAVVLTTRMGNPQGQPGTGGKVSLHFLAGVLALNIEGTLNIFRAIVGL